MEFSDHLPNGTLPTAVAVSELSTLEIFAERYAKVHGPLSLTVCVIGVVMNVIIVVALSHKDMVSPVNRLLQAIAVVDIITMMSYIPYSILFYIAHGTESGPERNAYGAVAYLVFHAICSIVSHTVSILLTVSVALFRYLYLSLKNGAALCDMKRANVCIWAVVAVSVLVNVPQMLVIRIKRYDNSATNVTWYYVYNDRLGAETSKTVNLVQYIVMATLVKIGPSTALIVLSALLIRIMVRVQRRYDKLNRRPGHESRRYEQTNKTTKLLIAVAVAFTLGELPQGVLFVLSGTMGPEFYTQIYHPLGNLLDLLIIVICGVNFVLYCSMSSQFRGVIANMLPAAGHPSCLTVAKGNSSRREVENSLLSTAVSGNQHNGHDASNGTAVVAGDDYRMNQSTCNSSM